LGVLSLAEMGQGNEQEAWDLAQESVRASIHLVLQTQHQDQQYDQDFSTVRALAYCGGFTLVRYDPVLFVIFSLYFPSRPLLT
jgi:hypothetical protein